VSCEEKEMLDNAGIFLKGYPYNLTLHKNREGYMLEKVSSKHPVIRQVLALCKDKEEIKFQLVFHAGYCDIITLNLGNFNIKDSTNIEQSMRLKNNIERLNKPENQIEEEHSLINKILRRKRFKKTSYERIKSYVMADVESFLELDKGFFANSEEEAKYAIQFHRKKQWKNEALRKAASLQKKDGSRCNCRKKWDPWEGAAESELYGVSSPFG
jgi:hypothetical protein